MRTAKAAVTSMSLRGAQQPDQDLCYVIPVQVQYLTSGIPDVVWKYNVRRIWALAFPKSAEDLKHAAQPCQDIKLYESDQRF